MCPLWEKLLVSGHFGSLLLQLNILLLEVQRCQK